MTLYRPAQISFPLDIPKMDVMGTKVTEKGQFIISVESQEETVVCGICQQRIACNYGHGQEIQLRHLPVLGYETYIAIRPRRGQCSTCLHGPTTTQQLDWYKPRSPHTKAYDRYLMKQLVNSTVADVSLKERVGYDAVLGVLGRQVPTAVNWAEIDNLGTIGIDEISLQKGHKSYRAVITARQDDGQVIILAVLTDRKKRA
jgi:transposase